MQAFQYKIVFADLPCENNITYDVPTVWMEGKKKRKRKKKHKKPQTKQQKVTKKQENTSLYKL